VVWCVLNPARLVCASRQGKTLACGETLGVGLVKRARSENTGTLADPRLMLARALPFRRLPLVRSSAPPATPACQKEQRTGSAVSQVGKHRGKGHLPVWGLEAAVERGCDPALRFGVAHAVAEQI
jgi:hypothetical protein